MTTMTRSDLDLDDVSLTRIGGLHSNNGTDSHECYKTGCGNSSSSSSESRAAIQVSQQRGKGKLGVAAAADEAADAAIQAASTL